MRAARLYAWRDVRVEEVPVPEIGAGEALVRIEACGVCGSDALTWYVDRKAADGPVVLGHEPAGVVESVGEGVENVRVGDRVFVHHHAPCMGCAECRRGLWSNCTVWRSTSLEPGGLAEYARVPAPNLAGDTLVLPDRIDFETATFVEPLATCVRALRRRGRLETGDAVLIVGFGAMGQLMVSLAGEYGARRILGSDFVADRRDRALRRGALAAWDPAATDVADAVREATDGRGADVVVVCPGTPEAVRAGLDAAAPGGRVVCFTPFAPGVELAIEPSDLYFREVSLTHSYSCGPDETREALALLAAGRVEVETLVTHRTGLDGTAHALERAHDSGDGMKTVVFPARGLQGAARGAS